MKLETVVTDDISRYQADSVIPFPQIVWNAEDEYLHGWMGFPYKPFTPQLLR